MVHTALLVLLGALLGGTLRLALSRLFQWLGLGPRPPWMALILSGLATFLLIALMAVALHAVGGGPVTRAKLVAGVCSGFSLLSALCYENYVLLRSGLLGLAVVNVILNVVFASGIFLLFATA